MTSAWNERSSPGAAKSANGKKREQRGGLRNEKQPAQAAKEMQALCVLRNK